MDIVSTRFNLNVEHRSAVKMQHVDCLSRFPQSCLVVKDEITARLKKAQQTDDHIIAIIEVLKQQPYKSFNVKGGLLFKEVEGNELLVVPKLMEREIIQRSHEIGHFSTRKTMHAIHQQYWIPHLETG
ncbi:uncharacterized protein LOC124461562 [Drosophila willistoni]|uniref:uncharacterized protein LOC124461562 n=1 Tax=Drosophila willistoni TaxID=7260 RepID=UPI001F07EF39|nr:uncharacterized protein LOC124461562 [Drosophila willistoni]